MTRRTARALAPVRWAAYSTRTARWTLEEHRRLQRDLPALGVNARVSPPPARTPLRAGSVVLGVLRVRHATCLERSLILQSWLHSHGQAHDVVIGVRHAGSVQAHAWVEDVEPSLDYLEIHRLPAA